MVQDQGRNRMGAKSGRAAVGNLLGVLGFMWGQCLVLQRTP